jgi:hypothetical protein
MSLRQNVKETAARAMGNKDAKAARESYDQRAADEDAACARHGEIDQAEICDEGEVPEAEVDRDSMYSYADVQYMNFREREMWGEEKGNPPDSPLRDREIGRAAVEWPEASICAPDVELIAPDGDWTFGDWAAVHNYGELQINRASEIEDWRGLIRERGEKQPEGEYFAGVFCQRQGADAEIGA